jgi:hypothetical protein
MGEKVSYYLVVKMRNVIPTMSSGYRPRAKIHQVFHLQDYPPRITMHATFLASNPQVWITLVEW